MVEVVFLPGIALWESQHTRCKLQNFPCYHSEQQSLLGHLFYIGFRPTEGSGLDFVCIRHSTNQM
jgi:hypothetical protein